MEAFLSWLPVFYFGMVGIFFVFSFRWGICAIIACCFAFAAYLLANIYFLKVSATVSDQSLMTIIVLQMSLATGLVCSYVFLPYKWTTSMPKMISVICGIIFLIVSIILTLYLLNIK